MNITKENAKVVALKLTGKLKDVYLAKRDLFEVALVELHQKRIPKEVVEFYDKYPNYCKTISDITVEGNGFNYLNFRLKKSVLGSPGFSPEIVDAKKLDVLRKDWDESEKSYRKIKDEIATSLVTLRTYNRIKQAFPEAYEFLPSEGTTAIAVCVDDLRNRLASSLAN